MKSIILKSLPLCIFFYLMMPKKAIAQNQWIGAVPTHYIPAFAGSTGSSRIASYTYASRVNDFIRKDPNAFSLMTQIAFDTYISKISTGIAFSSQIGYHSNTFIQNQSYVSNPFEKLETFGSALTIAPKISIKGKYTLSPALTGGISRAMFELLPDNKNITKATYSSSILINSKKSYLGYHYRPSSFTYRGDRLFPRHFLQTGIVFQRSEESKFAFTPNLAIVYYRYNLDALDKNIKLIHMSPIINLNFRYQDILFGVGNRQLMLGLQKEKIKLMAIYQHELIVYSYKHTTPNDYMNMSISIRYEIDRKSDNQVQSI